MLYEILGYVASVLVAISLTMKSILRLRIINFLGAVTFTVYGFCIEAYPVAVVNAFITIINIYYLYQMLSQTQYFEILQVDCRSKYLARFFQFYQQEIIKFQPDFTAKLSDDDIILLTLRDMIPAGVLIAKYNSSEEVEVKLDFVIPGYRDFKVGKFLLSEHEFFQGKTIYSLPGTALHRRYLEKMGFVAQESGQRYILKAL